MEEIYYNFYVCILLKHQPKTEVLTNIVNPGSGEGLSFLVLCFVDPVYYCCHLVRVNGSFTLCLSVIL